MWVDATDVRAALSGVLDVVRERADEIEARGSLPDEVVAALHGSGIHRLTVPEVLGGLQALVLELMEVGSSTRAGSWSDIVERA